MSLKNFNRPEDKEEKIGNNLIESYHNGLETCYLENFKVVRLLYMLFQIFLGIAHIKKTVHLFFINIEM